MRNYLYIPLGGNRHGTARTYLNLWVVFLLSGLWHGASWNFVIWGAYHGFFLVLERLLGINKQRKAWRIIPTFIILLVGWAIFRIEDLPSCWTFIQRLFSFDFSGFALAEHPQYYATLLVALVFSFLTLLPLGKRLERWVFYTRYRNTQLTAVWIIACLLFVCCLMTLTATKFSPFIYFRF